MFLVYGWRLAVAGKPVRYARWSFIRTTRGLGGNPITDVWAPLDGRTFNLGIGSYL